MVTSISCQSMRAVGQRTGPLQCQLRSSRMIVLTFSTRVGSRTPELFGKDSGLHCNDSRGTSARNRVWCESVRFSERPVRWNVSVFLTARVWYGSKKRGQVALPCWERT